MIYDKIEEL